jgi:ATP-binding cassette subfamily B protein
METTPASSTKPRNLSKNISAYLKILGIMSRDNQVLFATTFVITILISQLPAVLAYLSKSIIDSLTLKDPTQYYGLQAPLFLGCVYLSLLLVQYVGQVLVPYVNETLTESGSRNIHLEIIKSAIHLEGLYYFDDPAFHNRRALLERDALYIPMNFLRFVLDICSITVTTLGMIVLLFWLHPFIPLLIILSGIPDVLTQRRAHRVIYEGVKETAGEERMKDYYRSVLVNDEYAKEVRLYNLSNYFIDKYSDAVMRVFRLVLPIRKRQIRASVLSRIVVSVGTILPYLWTLDKAVRGEISAGQLVMFMTAIVVIQQQISRTAQTLAGHQDVNYVMRELASWLEMKPDLPVIKQSHQTGRKHHLPPQIRISNLWFKYPGSEREVLKGLDVDIDKGKSLAIVGRNGSGKTTLVKLLCRLYDPQQGNIYYDDVNARLINLEDLRNSIGIIFQDFSRYHLTVRENITLGKVADDTWLNDVYRAAETAGAEDFVKGLSQGYDTLLGKQFPVGVELSGGQWQRLALARAFCRDAGLLILDEPTASLDIATEARIYAHFKTMTKGKTALLISHRLSTVRIADRIAVIDDGKVVELGDHESLMCLGGIYNEMFSMQAERFRLKSELATTV